MPKVTEREMLGLEAGDGFHIDPEQGRLEEIAARPDTVLDIATVEAFRKSAVWAVMSKAIRAVLHERNQQVRSIKITGDARAWIAGNIVGLEFLHKTIWEAMLRKPRPGEEKESSDIDPIAVKDETEQIIQELEKEFN